MEARISIITLRVTDLERSYGFYHKGMELPTTRKPDEVISNSRGFPKHSFKFQSLSGFNNWG